MNRIDARLAVRVNAIVEDRYKKISGYAYCLSWIHMKGKEPYEQIGYLDKNGNCVYAGRIEDIDVIEWGFEEAWIAEELKKLKEKAKEKAE